MDQSSISKSLSKNQNMDRNIMKGEFKKFGLQSLWIQSPCTIPFSSKLPPLEQAKRFHYNSIYYRDNPFAPAKKIDEFQKPDLLLTQFRRQIKQTQNWVKRNQKLATTHTNKTNSKKNKNKPFISHINKQQSVPSLEFQANQQNLSRQNIQKGLIDRLYPKSPKKIKLQYDKYGNRSSFYVDTEVEIASIKKQKSTKDRKKMHMQKYSLPSVQGMFTESVRMDLSRPENFNPGPGYYFQNFRSIDNSHLSRRVDKENAQNRSIELSPKTSHKISNKKQQSNSKHKSKIESVKIINQIGNHEKLIMKGFPTENSLEESET